MNGDPPPPRPPGRYGHLLAPLLVLCFFLLMAIAGLGVLRWNTTTTAVRRCVESDDPTLADPRLNPARNVAVLRDPDGRTVAIDGDVDGERFIMVRKCP